MTEIKLPFLWWENGDQNKALIECRICVYLFGTTSSAGCANFALKQTAEDFKDNFDQNTVDVINKCFYVDFNPADHASHGLSIKNTLKCIQWKVGLTS